MTSRNQRHVPHLTTAFKVDARGVLLNCWLARDVQRSNWKNTRHDRRAAALHPPGRMRLANWHPHSLSLPANTGGHMPLETLTKLRQRALKAEPSLMHGLTEAFRSCYLTPEEVDHRPGSIDNAT